MTAQQNKEVVRTVVEEGWNKGNFSNFENIIDSNYIYHIPGDQKFKGPEGLKQVISMYRSAFPDFKVEIEDLIAEGDKVVGCFAFGGTFKGELMGIQPTGKKFLIKGVVRSRVENGKEVEAIGYSDQLSMFQQLGIKPPGF